MKKEYIILVVVIAGLCAYLALKKDNQINYDLPTLATVETTAVDQIHITGGDTPLTLSKTDKGWTVSDKAYPAASAAVNDVLDTVKTLNLSALVSESGNLVRYDLDPDNALYARVLANGKVVREFTIGKTAPSGNHTFVMLKNDTRVFQADNSFRDQFDKSVDEFRDKEVLRLKPADINTIFLEKNGVFQTLTRNALEKDLPEDQLQDQAQDKKAAKTPAIQWVTADGTPADQTAVQDLLASLSRLECQNYKDDAGAAALKKQTPTCKISLENHQTFGLNIFSETQGDGVAATSSGSPYAFDLASYRAEDIVSYVDQILGLKPQEKPSD
jgi:hypothetical protein